MSAALGRPEQARAPLGGRESHEVDERGGQSRAALGRPEQARSPVGGREPHEVGKHRGHE